MEASLALIVITAGAVASGAAAALAWSRYRDSRDPHLLFLATGALVVAGQLGVVAGWRYRHALSLTLTGSLRTGEPAARLPISIWQLGWVIAGACFLLGLPWWDRRGRAPIRAGVVASVALAIAVAGDVALVLTYPTRAAGGSFAVGGPATVGGSTGVGAIGWLLGLAAFGLLAAAAVRELLVASTRRGVHPWLGGAFGLAAVLQLALLHRPTPGLPSPQPADWIQLLVPALAFAGLLVAQRAEVSRMRRASDRAEEVMGGRAEIASMMAHEVRGPVSSVRGLAATTLGSYDRLSDDERRELVGLIEQEARRLVSTVDQTSLALKVDAGTLSMTMRPDDLGAAVREAARGVAPGRPVQIEAEPDVTARIDRRWIAEIVRQLMDNAEKFSPAGEPIGVAVRRENGHAVIEITDAGPGIPPDKRDLVFTKFAKWRSPGYEEIPGSGLGLFICRGLAAEHQGDVVVVGRPRGGTMLRVRLPLEA
jgi:signal transduction histidine kinase